MAPAHPESSIPDIIAEISDKGDCPAMAQAITEFHAIRKRDNFPTQDLAKVILKDPGLSVKVLRVVNSAFFRTRGDPITTITRAVVMLGIDAVVDLASGILLVEQFDQRDPALAESLLESLRAAMLAQALAERLSLPDSEEAYLLGLVSNLGRFWLAAHYREELARAVELEAREAISIADAIKRHFGFTPDVLAAKILHQWGLPAKYINFFRRHGGRGGGESVEEKLIMVAELSTEPDPAEFVQLAVRRLNLSEERAQEVVDSARESLAKQAEALGILPLPKPEFGRLKELTKRAKSEPSRPEEAPAKRAEQPPPSRPRPDRKVNRKPRAPDPAHGVLAAAEIARAIVDRTDLESVLPKLLEGRARAGGFDAAVLYLADKDRENITARFACGEDVPEDLDVLANQMTPKGGLAVATLLEDAPKIEENASAALLVGADVPPPEFPIDSIATHPLSVRGRVTGVLLVTRAIPPQSTPPLSPSSNSSPNSPPSP